MKMPNAVRLSYKDLACYTDNFCPQNYIGHFQFGKLYRGKIMRDGLTLYVMVKIWEVPTQYFYEPGDNETRLMDELILLRHAKLVNHRGMVNLYGFCFEGDHLGVVYKFKPFDSIYNLIHKDSFTWLHRIKVAFGVASVLEFLHGVKRSSHKPFIVRNLDCAHIVLEEDYNPKLCDFGLITGGVFPDRTIFRLHHVLGCHGYIDFSACAGGPEYSDKKDVFGFGVILLSLISKRVYNSEDHNPDAVSVSDWAVVKYYKLDDSVDDDDEGSNKKKLKFTKKPKCSLVDERLAADPHFDPADGHKLTALGIRCVDDRCHLRPTMRQIMNSLRKLKIVQEHADFLGLTKGNKNEPMMMD